MKICQFCGIELVRKVWFGKRKYTETTARWNERKFCDNVCRSKQLAIDSAGSKNYFYGKNLRPWNKKEDAFLRIKCGRGYFQIRYFENGVRKVKSEHRFVMEKALGRELRPEEVVHHIDENPSNNSLDNLMLFENDAEHKRHHRENRHKLLSA